MFNKITICLFFALTLCSTALLAQFNEGQSADKIIAVVGNEVIMKSDLDGFLQSYAQQNKSLNVNDPKVREQILDELINEKLVIIKAQEDSVDITEDEVTERLNYQIQSMVDQVGSEKRIEDIYGMSITAIKREYKDDIRKQLLYEKMRQTKVADIKVTAREVQEFFAKYQDSIPTIQQEVEISHILKYVVTSVSKKEEVMKFAHKIRDSILLGASFEEMAKKYSDDPGSAVVGGDLGWRDKGQLVPEYEKAAFAMQKGEISLPIESPFGFHLIKLIDKNKDAINTKHILLKISQSSDDNERAIAALKAIKSKADSGAKFEDLAKAYSEEKETQGFGGVLGKFDISTLPYGMKDVVAKLRTGEISDPIEYNVNPSKPAYHIIKRGNETPAHKANLEQDYKRVEQLATMFKQNKEYNEWVESLRKTIYWEKKGE